MTVSVTRGGVTRTAHAHVTTVPCPTSNSILNSPAIRQAFKDLISASGPDLPPGDGIASGDSVGNKREHSGFVYQTAGGEYYFVEDVGSQQGGNSTECKNRQISNPDALKHNSTDTYVAHVHTHPTHAGDEVFGCPPDANGPGTVILRRRGPWDTDRPPSTKRPDSQTGGGSLWGDWITVVTNYRDEYVINADGEVWQLPRDLMFSEQSGNRLFWKYKGNSDASCNW